MACDKQWGGHVELMALSSALKLVFCLFKETKEIIVIDNVDDDSNNPNNQLLQRKTAFYEKKAHYFSLIPKKDQKEMITNQNIEIKLRKKIYVTKQSKQNIKQNLLTEIKNFFNLKIKIKVKPKPKDNNEVSLDSKKNQSPQNIENIDFKNIFLLKDEKLIQWCIQIGFLKLPNHYRSCKRSTGKKVKKISNFSE